MRICEFCGRLHQVQVPDYHFCSTHCRQQQQLFLADAGYTPTGEPTVLDYALTEADYLAGHLMSISYRAKLLVREAAEAKNEDDIWPKKEALILELSEYNSVAQRIYKITNPYLFVKVEAPTEE